LPVSIVIDVYKKQKNMKKIALISAIALSGLFYNNVNAQVRIGFGIHINTPSVRVIAESPAYTSYNTADDYYYMPDVDAYYSAYENAYYYNDGERWVSAAYLPGAYRNYDWRNARHYEVRAHRPYLNADIYRERYRGNAYNWNRRDDRFDNRKDDRVDNRNYANRDDRRDNELRFERRNDEHAYNRGNDNGGRNYNRFDNRGQNNANQRSREQVDYNQPSQQQRGQGGQQDRGRGNYNQQPTQSQPSQPSRGGYGGQQRGSMNSGDHFVYNSGQNQRRF
jgi:hypothetical protein